MKWQRITRAIGASASLILLMSLVPGCSSDASSITSNGNGTDDPVVTGYPIVDTGQDACYDNSDEITPPARGEAFYGQDAQFDGDQFSFVDNGDGTVTDLNTGLMWQQTPPSTGFGWEEAVNYCESLELAGYDDWRAPSLKELFSISDFESGWPYIDMGYFDLAGGTVSKDQQYWSSNFYYVGMTHGGAETAFGVNHGAGHIKGYPSARGPFGKHVRAVRGDVYGLNDFADNGDGTITDQASGLMWMQSDLGLAVDWEHALLLADTLSYAGYDDWRLPDVKELQSIVDYSGVFPAIDPLFSCTPIINEGGDADFGYYWTSTSAYFGPDRPDYYYAWYVAFGRAVGPDGEDSHGAGAVRFDTKVEGGPLGEGGERYYNYVRCVRDVD